MAISGILNIGILPALTGMHSVVLILCLSALCLILLRRALLPKLYHGIPHHPQAGRGILGDLPRLITHAKQSGGEVLDWMSMQCVDLRSPIIQLAVKPLSPPFIFIDDQVTAEDILTKRTPREFDRAVSTKEMFNHLIPKASMLMRSDDKFKALRRNWNGTMSPVFLNKVAAPFIHDAFVNLVDLWRLKGSLAKGKCFAVGEDIKLTTLDAIWAVSHGSQLGAVKAQIDALAGQAPIKSVEGEDAPVTLPNAALPKLAKAIERLVDTVTTNAPFPKLREYYLNCLSSFTSAIAIKDASVAIMLSEARADFAHTSEENRKVTCAMDYVISKEMSGSAKADQLGIDEKAHMDEAFQFILGGQETMSTTIQWFVKFMGRHQDIQQRLHDDLVAALPVNFSSSDLIDANIPYLDAVVHETLRVSRTAPTVARQAMVDTQVLGYHIPKGATLIISFQHDQVLIDSTLTKPDIPKSDGYRPLERTWDPVGKRDFEPARWLTTVDGKEAFDLAAGPSTPFSLGTRGCFGKRLALLELRVAIALLVRGLRFGKVPAELDSDKASQLITRVPLQCFARVTGVD